MKWVRGAHDLALALLVGGIATGLIAAVILFDRAPSRAVAAPIGQAIFDALGWMVLGLSGLVLAARVALRRSGLALPSPLWLPALGAVLALFVALWLTPTMEAVYQAGPHAADGSGLVDAARAGFMRLHVAADVSYLLMLAAGAAQIVWNAAGRRD